MTSCSSGTMSIWNNRFREDEKLDFAFKRSKYLALTYDPEYSLLIGCCQDMKTRFFNSTEPNMPFFEYDSTPVQYTSVFIHKKLQVIFFGTSIGSVRVYLWPFYEYIKDNLEYVEFPVHQSAVISMKVTCDYSNLVTASLDGSIYILRVKKFVNGTDISSYDVLSLATGGGKRKETLSRMNAYLLASLCLVGKSHMDVNNITIHI